MVEKFAREVDLNAVGISPEEVRAFLDGFLDFVEFTILSMPFRQVVGYLCELAQNCVLTTSLERVVLDDEFDRVLHAVWLLDVNAERGYHALKSSLKKMPQSMFFRLNLASHLLTRAYWSHWRVADRLLLLDSAAETLRSTPAGIGHKAEIQRLIIGKSATLDSGWEAAED